MMKNLIILINLMMLINTNDESDNELNYDEKSNDVDKY